MPLLANIGFVDQDFRVAYRASGKPQRVTIDVQTEGVAGQPVFGVFLAAMERMIQRGGASGDRFAPWKAGAKILTRPRGTAEYGPDYHAELEAAGLAPEFLRFAMARGRKRALCRALFPYAAGPFPSSSRSPSRLRISGASFLKAGDSMYPICSASEGWRISALPDEMRTT
jgi:hypothetical protein